MPNSKNLPLPNPARLSDGSDGGSPSEVHDGVTGLVWSREISALVAYDEASAHCVELPAARASTVTDSRWRLPTRIELVSLIDRTYAPTIDPIFGSTPADYFWSSSPVPGHDARFSVYFGVGETAWGPERTSHAFARCVRGGKRAQADEYFVDGDAVLARATGLTWQRSSSTARLSLSAAREYCEALELGGAEARLPTPKELQTLVDPGLPELWLDLEVFDPPAGSEFWADEGASLPVMRVDFVSGFTGLADSDASYFTRCVR